MARLGLKQGDLVVVRTDQSVRTAIILFAVARIGATAALLDPRADLDAARFGTPMIIGAGICRTAAGTFPLDPAALPDALAGDNSTDPNGPSFVLLTSGSTGEQKAVVLSQANLIENLLESAPLGDYRPGDLALGAAPMDHVFGLVLLFGTVVLGYGLYLLAEKEAGAVLAAIEKQRLTRMNGVPSLYLAMAEHRTGYDLGSLRCGFIGGGPWTAEALWGAEALVELRIPATVESLPGRVFAGAPNLTRLILEHTDRVVTIQPDTFAGAEQVKIYVPSIAYPLYRKVPGCEVSPWAEYWDRIVPMG